MVGHPIDRPESTFDRWASIGPRRTGCISGELALGEDSEALKPVTDTATGGTVVRDHTFCVIPLIRNSGGLGVD